MTEGVFMTRYGYARISTDDQTHDPQLLALEREGVREIVLDTVSGGVPAASRPGLSELLAKLQPGDSEPPRDWRRPIHLRRRSDEQFCEEVFA